MGENLESKLIEDMVDLDKFNSFLIPGKDNSVKFDHTEAIEKVSDEIDSLSEEELDDWTETFLNVGKEYFEPEVYDEASLILESKLGMSFQDWSLLKLRERNL